MELNAANERLKHRYFVYLREADRFEEQNHRRSFREFRIERASQLQETPHQIEL
jgi:hypothetical protein